MGYGILIRKIRDSLGMTLTQFAIKVKVSKSHIHRLENEFSNKGKEKLSPPLDLLKQICDRTNYSFRQFLEEAGYISPPPKTTIQERFDRLTPSQQADLLKLTEYMLESDDGQELHSFFDIQPNG